MEYISFFIDLSAHIASIQFKIKINSHLSSRFHAKMKVKKDLMCLYDVWYHHL